MGGHDKFHVCTWWKVGKSDRVTLWHDSWLVDGTLRDQYPQIFVISQQKDILISHAFWDLGGGERVWQITILRNLSDWEINEYEKLLSTLSLVFLEGSNDSSIWCLTMNDSFPIKSFYKHFDQVGRLWHQIFSWTNMEGESPFQRIFFLGGQQREHSYHW